MSARVVMTGLARPAAAAVLALGPGGAKDTGPSGDGRAS